MTDQKYIYTVICLFLCSIFHTISAAEACDKSRCEGPIKYYEDLNCIPIYDSRDSCCAVKYNCDHLKGRSENKCYFKGHEYEIGQTLREGDARPCDIGCHCAPGWNGPAHFSCAIVDCFNRPGPGCYLKSADNQCCPGPQVCLPPYGNDTVAECEVDGKTYYDGQRFTPKSDPTLSCICAEGYTGENVAPFCKPVVVETISCNVELRHATELFNNCTPAFYSNQNPATDCNIFSRCQNKNDTVIVRDPPVSDSDDTCIFGQLSMKIGDELNAGTDWSSVCLKCVCEVPPMPTCRRLRDDQCDITVHADFY